MTTIHDMCVLDGRKTVWVGGGKQQQLREKNVFVWVQEIELYSNIN